MLQILQNQYVQSLLDFIYPNLCLGCGEYISQDVQICEKCELRIQKIILPYCLRCMTYMENDIICSVCKNNSLALFSYATYADPIREIIIQYKFKNITTPSKIFAQRLFDLYENLLQKCNADYFIPIPLHKSRETSRGYNQAFLLAKELEKISGIRTNDSILIRDLKRKPQAKLTIEERKLNIESVFSIEEPTEEIKTCIIVDDVVTTGSTVFEAAKELENSGYKVAAVISIAHTF